jgi:hypothetical protein
MLSGSSTTDGDGDEVGDEYGDADEINGVVGERSLSKMLSDSDAPFVEDEDNVPVDSVPAGEDGGDC